MPIAATRDVPFVHPRPLPVQSAWTRLVSTVHFMVETMQEAQRDAREAHRKYPFVDW
jgi:hypothetical protein